MKRLLLFILLIFCQFNSFAQSDLDKMIKTGELLLSGITVFKVAKSDGKSDSKTIEIICVKNFVLTLMKMYRKTVPEFEITFIHLQYQNNKTIFKN